ncbi:hypothetical protein [Streptomyces sp. NPDC048521]|uniref:hypothetical protein n=1 Tax=Streptomyces sp. NPDC048521 TaxID=3365566 RepID=UPI0037129016
MRKMRRVGAVAGVVVSVLLIGGCSDGGDDKAAEDTGKSIDELNRELLSPSPDDDDSFVDGGGYDPDVMDGSVDSPTAVAPARQMSEGSYEIGTKPRSGDGEVEVALPGTYVLQDPLPDCYWERSTEGGDIIENRFVTAAKRLTVTVRVGELFTSRECGTWSLVK